MKKISIRLGGFVALFALCAAIAIWEGVEIFRLNNAPCCCELNDHIDFQDVLDRFPNPEYENVGEIRAKEAAIDAAKRLWAEKGYTDIDDSAIMATYCSKYHFWYVRETRNYLLNPSLGPLPLALIRFDGSVLVVWKG